MMRSINLVGFWPIRGGTLTPHVGVHPLPFVSIETRARGPAFLATQLWGHMP
jgi:hypothetical protein